jgi:hypothetical protein
MNRAGKQAAIQGLKVKMRYNWGMEETRPHKALFLLPVALALVLLVGSLAWPDRVQAGSPLLDGGGLPTRTPTQPPPTLTPTATQDSIFPPTATHTQVPGSPNELLAPNAGMTAEQPSRFSFLSCWPFALVVLLVLIIGVMWLSGRLRQNTV